MANEAINLNLIPDGVKPVAHVSQYDVGRVVTFSLYQGPDVYTPPAGTTLEFRELKSDKHICVYDDAATLSGSTITLETTQQMTAAAGEALCQFKLTNGADVLATLNFWLDVQEDPAATGDISDTEIPGIVALAEEQMERAESAADTAESAMNDAIRQAGAAAASAQTASQMASSAQDSASAAASSEDQAQYYANQAEDTVEDGIQTMSGLVNNAQYYSEAAHDWAVGPNGSGSATATNNAKYWSDLAAQYAAQFGSAVKWRGVIVFASIPTSGMMNGDFYDISDAFTTDSRFAVGAGVSEPAGTDIIWNETTSKWDIDTPDGVASFNGRMGAVSPQPGDYTAAMVGLGNVDNTPDANKTVAKANALNVSAAVGSATRGVYIDADGKPQPMTNTVEKSVPSGAKFTDQYVSQTNLTSSSDRRILLSSSSNDTTATAGAYKSSNFYANPATGILHATTLDSNNISDMNNVLGAKNFLKYPYAETTITKNGVTFTVNSDGSVKVTGSATAAADFQLNSLADLTIDSNQTYILSGCPSGGSAASYGINYTNASNKDYLDTGEGVSIERYPDSYTNQKIYIYISPSCVIPSGGLLFKPMIRLASDPDETYAPYAMTNRALTEYLVPQGYTLGVNTNNVTLQYLSTYTINNVMLINFTFTTTGNPGTQIGALSKDGAAVSIRDRVLGVADGYDTPNALFDISTSGIINFITGIAANKWYTINCQCVLDI